MLVSDWLRRHFIECTSECSDLIRRVRSLQTAPSSLFGILANEMLRYFEELVMNLTLKEEVLKNYPYSLPHLVSQSNMYNASGKICARPIYM